MVRVKLALTIYQYIAEKEVIVARSVVMDDSQWANPAALGLAGFGLNTILLQIHNIGQKVLYSYLAYLLSFNSPSRNQWPLAS